MNFELKSLALAGVLNEECDTLVVLVPESFKAGRDALSLLIAQTLKSKDFSCDTGRFLSLYRPQQNGPLRVVFAGVGQGQGAQVRTAVLAALGPLKSSGMKRIVVCFSVPALDSGIRAAVMAIAEATYVYTTTKSKVQARTVQKVLVATSNASKLKVSFDRAVAAVLGIELAKEWANRPANHATPTLLASAAKELAKYPKISCTVLGLKEVSKLGMGAFMAVAQGSAQPLQFIVLRYEGAAKAQAPTVLVGKGITFDSGGLSIKPAAEMDEMKFDMSGAASVLGVFRALASLKPSINVVGLIPSCENLPDGGAVKPGDVVTSMSGKTIEILNTDAEGRLILCDALTYAQRFNPAAVIDVATLTGACAVALGEVRSGLFVSQDELGFALMAAGEASLDLCWRLPLDEDYAEGLKTNFADVANVAGRLGGAVTAAKFLHKFAEEFPWAHLDIAGTAWKNGASKGATGRPVALLVEYLLAQAAK